MPSSPNTGPLLAREISQATGLSLPLVAEKLELLAPEYYPINCHASVNSLDPTLREKLIEALLVHETFFFRHPNQWLLLRSQLPGLAARSVRRSLVAWSAGCSTGEEAWSLAYLLAREGLKGTVIGTDISKSSIAIATAGTYRRLERMGSLRDIPDFALADFPTRVGVTWNARSELRAVTRFMPLSLLAPPPVGRADIVFCRNVMIYLSPAIVEDLIRRIAAIMPEGGILALGGAEFLQQTEFFSPCHGDGAYVFQRNGKLA